MHFHSLLTSYLYPLFLLTPHPSTPSPTPSCKPTPGSTAWPSLTAWNKLNHTLHGALISPPPPGAVCHPTHPLYSNTSCTDLLKSWLSSDWHAQNPITSDYNDDTCPPIITTSDPSSAVCSRDGYPAYTVNASTYAHVAAAVTFARQTDVRLTIKGTGHDFPGRSAGAGSLSVYTHNIRGVKVLRNNKWAAKYGKPAVLKVKAGMRWKEVYEVAAEEGLTVVGGGDPDVGVGGWTGGGGHSPISSLWGLGADNVVEMEVVGADGVVRTLDGESEGDERELFWAMRGGGPSTYAIMLSVTYLTHPSLTTTSYTFLYNTTALTPTFWNMTALFHQHLPRISHGGGMGYYWAFSDLSVLTDDAMASSLPVDISNLSPNQSGLVFGAFLFNHTNSSVNPIKIMAPLEDDLRSLSQQSNFDEIFASGQLSPPFPFTEVWAATQSQSVGSTHTRLGSYLLSNASLNLPIEDLAEGLASANGGGGPYPQLGHLVAGPAVHAFGGEEGQGKLPGGGNAVNPAWRKAYTHVVLPGGWQEGEKAEEGKQSLRERVKVLREMEGEGGGAYANEADPSVGEWKADFWGGNYERLREVKGKWDPEGVFWCRGCVGSDEWEVVKEEGSDGVGQGVRGLCRVQK